MPTLDPKALAHLEDVLGPCVGSWDRQASGTQVSVPLARFDGPFLGATTIATVGLSQHVLKQYAHPHTDLRQELLWGAWTRFSSSAVLSRVEDLAELAIKSGVAFQRGECRDYGSPVFPGSPLTGLYFALPGYYPERLTLLEGAHREPVIFMWVVPVSGAEAQLVRKEGWKILEDLFVQRDPDLFDLRRDSLV